MLDSRLTFEAGVNYHTKPSFTFTDDQACCDTGLQPDTVLAGLLQCCVAWSCRTLQRELFFRYRDMRWSDAQPLLEQLQ